MAVINRIKTDLLLNLKNIYGWKTDRKIVVFSVDDYGNVRLDSRSARENLDKAGLRTLVRFDAYDSLENREDLEILFETLDSVKDVNGQSAKFTLFSVPCNIDFERIAEEGYLEYHYELLPVTFQKLASMNNKSYEGAWKLWKEGISHGLIVPQFHGREHLNLKVFREKLITRDAELMSLLKNRSYTSISNTGYTTIDWSAAFDFWEFNENQGFEEIIRDGLNAFEEVFGFRSLHFNSPGRSEHKIIHDFLFRNGINYIDSPVVKKEHRGKGLYKTEFYYTGKSNNSNMLHNVRNVVFEPTEDKGIDWVNFAIRQIEAAFRWNRPAVISSHRVNFCGNISEINRQCGIDNLKKLLKQIVSRWPEVEFMSSDSMMDLIRKQRNR
jgi:hypothetical protein